MKHIHAIYAYLLVCLNVPCLHLCLQRHCHVCIDSYLYLLLKEGFWQINAVPMNPHNYHINVWLSAQLYMCLHDPSWAWKTELSQKPMISIACMLAGIIMSVRRLSWLITRISCFTKSDSWVFSKYKFRGFSWILVRAKCLQPAE